MHQKDSTAFTLYGYGICLWIILVSFQYGYHISALNQIQAVLTCKDTSKNLFTTGLPQCIPMTDLTFSSVTSIFTLGGLVGSLCAQSTIDRWGRKNTIQISTLFMALGSGLMTASGSVSGLGFGRLLTGIGSGIGLCVGPIFLSEIAPATIKGNVGVLTQLAIVFGIMVTQCLGLKFATPSQWRIVLGFSFVLALVELVLGIIMIESPAALHGRGASEEALAVGQRIWGAHPTPHHAPDLEQDPLLSSDSTPDEPTTRTPSLTIPQLLRAPELRKPLWIIILAMSSQQLSGVNAVLYYSNDILSSSLPSYGPYISLGITVVNTIMTFPTIFLIERTGRRKLLQFSAIGAVLSLVAVGWGLDSGSVTLASVTIITFIMSFAIGLGPVPFILIPEVSPFHAVSSISSIGLSLNWIVNGLVGLAFLPLRNAISGGDKDKEGRVFYVFATLLALGMFSLGRLYRG